MRHKSVWVVAMAAGAMYWSAAASAEDVPGICCLEPAETVPVQRAAARGTAEDTVLTFEGLDSLEQILDFYAGGVGGEGSGPGPDFGTTFSDNALAIVSQGFGGTGNFARNPSGDTILFFLEGDAATMNLADGFEEGFSFFYSACCSPGVVTVYDGPDGTGNVLAELQLPTTPATDETPYAYDNWRAFGVEFDGVAHSVDFGGTIDRIGFDNITPGSNVPGGAEPPVSPPSPVAVPATPAMGVLVMIMLFTGLAMVGLTRLKGSGA